MASVARSQVQSVRYFAVAGIVVPILFAVLVTVAGIVQEGYSHASQAISELGGVGADVPLIQNLNFFVTGLLIMVFAVGLQRFLGLRGKAAVGPMLVAVFGFVTAFLQPLLPCDVGCEGETTIGGLHNLTGLTSFLSVTSGMVLTARQFSHDWRWASYARPTVAAAIAALLALVAWIAIGEIAGVDAVNGVLQRTFVGIVMIWIGVTAFKLWRLAGADDR